MFNWRPGHFQISLENWKHMLFYWNCFLQYISCQGRGFKRKAVCYILKALLQSYAKRTIIRRIIRKDYVTWAKGRVFTTLQRIWRYTTVLPFFANCFFVWEVHTEKSHTHSILYCTCPLIALLVWGGVKWVCVKCILHSPAARRCSEVHSAAAVTPPLQPWTSKVAKVASKPTQSYFHAEIGFFIAAICSRTFLGLKCIGL